MSVVKEANTEVENPTDLEQLTARIDDFLRDPIGYGDYDCANPISLAEFSTARHFHGRYVSALT